MEPEITIVRTTKRERDDLKFLVARSEAENRPDDPPAATHVPSGMAESLSRHDASSSDSAWFPIADRDGRSVGWVGLAGIRLLTRPGNRPAPAFYNSAGFRKHETLLYQIRVERHDPSF